MLSRRPFFRGSRGSRQKNLAERVVTPSPPSPPSGTYSRAARTSVRPRPELVIRPVGQFFFPLSLALPLFPCLLLPSLFLRPYLVLTSQVLLPFNGGTGINLYAVRVCMPLFLAIPRNLQETSRTLGRPSLGRERTRAIVPARRAWKGEVLPW